MLSGTRLFASRIVRVGVALILCSLASPAQDTAPTKSAVPANNFRIAGTIVNGRTGAPLEEARVTIQNAKSRATVGSVVTGEDGRFEFTQLPAGKYGLQGAKRGFLPGSYEQHEQFSTAIVTGPEFQTENLVLRLTPMAVISGHIFDEAGDPVRSAQVVLYAEQNGGGMSRIMRFGTATSDDRGYYDFFLLGPGNYFLSATAKPWYAIHPTIGVDATANSQQHIPAGLDVAYPTTFYNGTIDADEATPIALKGGDHAEIDLRLNPVPSLHLIFRVPEDQQGFDTPILQKHVFDSVEPVDSGEERSLAPGVFEFTGIPAGRYTIRARNPSSGEMEQAGDVELLHNGQELNSTRGEPVGSVKVTVRMPGQESMPKQLAIAVLDSRPRAVAVKRADASGEASFDDLVPGKYWLMVASPTKPYFVARSTSQNGETLGHELNIVPGTNLELTAFVLGGVVSVEGVVNKAGKPLAGVMVVLVPKDPEAHIELFRRDQSDFDGTFLVPNVVPGSYTIVAVEDAWGFDWLKPGILARYVQHGQELTISEHMQGSVYLPDPVEVQPR
jgi:hypothetical protein